MTFDGRMLTVPFTLVRAVSPADDERVASFAVAYYHPEEPFNLAINRATGRTEYPIDYDIQYVLQFLDQGYSLLAVDGSDVIGIAILREIDTDHWATVAALLDNSQTLDEKIVYSFYKHLEKEAGFREEGDPEKTLELHILAVGAAARGKGVGKALIEGSWQVARDHGFKVFRMDCTGLYSARLAEACGLTRVYTLDYQDFKDENGEVVLKPPEPHKTYSVFKKKL